MTGTVPRLVLYSFYHRVDLIREYLMSWYPAQELAWWYVSLRFRFGACHTLAALARVTFTFTLPLIKTIKAKQNY